MTTFSRGFRRHALAAAVCMTLAGVAHGQISSATLRGAVTGAARANAEVAATNVDTGFTLRTRANAEGNYALTGLPPGSYKVTVTGADGKKSESTVTLQVGQTANVDLASGAPAAAASSLDRVVVTGAAVPDKKTSEVGTYVTPQQMQRLPQVTRNFLSFADMAPGVNVQYDAEGNVKLRGGASNRDSVNVFIDGVGQKDYVMRGGTTGQDRSRGNPFPQSALAEYKVISQNYKAEFDQVSSAAITAITKSGTNEFHGDAFIDHTASNMRAKRPDEAKAGSKLKTSQEQYGVSIGGPIIKDQMHFFLAYEGKQNKDPRSVAAGGPPQALAALPASALAQIGPVSAPFKEDLLFAKLDWAPNETNRFDLSLKIRQEADRKHIGDKEAPEFASDNKVDETRLDLKHQYSGERFTNEARLTYEDAFFSQQPLNSNFGVRYRYVQQTGGPNSNTNSDDEVLNAGGNNFYQRKGQKGVAFQNDLTLTGIEAAGQHILKFGVKVKQITIEADERLNGTPQFFYDLAPGGSLTTPFKVEFGAPLAGVGNGSVSGKNTQLGLYAQDDWEVNKNLTLNLGLRWDYEHSPTFLDQQTPADVIAALNSRDPRQPNGQNQTYAQSLARGGVNINDYISTGSNRKAFKKGFQPRLGFSYDLFGDKQHVVFGGYGRSYDRNIFDIMQLERTKGTYPNTTISFLGNPNYASCRIPTPTCVPFSTNYFEPGGLAALAVSGAGREINLLNNNLKTPYADQFALGIRDTLGQWQTEIGYSHVENKDMTVFLLGNRRFDGTFYEPGRTSGPPWGSGIPGLGSLILGTNGLSSKTDSVYFKIDKPYTRESGWSTTFAYTYSRVRENHNLNDDFRYSLDFPSPDVIPFFRSTVVPRHKLVATGSYDLPWGVALAAKLTLASPLAIRDFNCNGQECKPDIADKKSFRQVDVSLSKFFPIGGGARMSLRADVINLFNARNYDDFSVAWGAPGQPNVATPGVNLAGPPRTLKVGLGVNW